MKQKFTTFLAAACGLMLISGCASVSRHLAPYNPPAYKPHNPNNVRVDVSLSKQQVYVMEGNRCLLAAVLNIGLPGHATPRGHFTIYRKIAHKRSGAYGYWVRGNTVIPGKGGNRPSAGFHYVGYPMPFWCEFSPGYGFHEGYVWPLPHTHGCLRMHKNVAPKFFQIVKVGTPVYIANHQPQDATIGANLPHPNDYRDPNPSNAFMVSPAVFNPGGPI